MIVYLNGTFVDDKKASISVWDAGFLFGEGVFTTLRLNNGVPLDLKSHWARLARQARELAIPFATTEQELRNIVGILVEKNHLENFPARMRITLSRGGDPDQPLPLSPDPTMTPTLLLTLSPLPTGFDDEFAKGIEVITLGPEYVRRCLPHLKSLNFLPSLIALREARRLMCNEAIIFNDAGFVTEAAVSSVFICRKKEIVTPKNNGNILAGCTRQMILDLTGKNEIHCREDDISRGDLETSTEVFLVNSIRGVVPVCKIDGHTVGGPGPGPVTENIRRWYLQAMHST